MKSMPPNPELIGTVAVAMGRCALFRGMPQTLLQNAAAQATLVQVEPGEYLTKEGEVADAFHIVMNGKASVLVQRPERQEEAEIAQIGPADTVGEVALLLGQPYLASMKATTRMVVARFDASFFDTMAKQFPDFGLKLAKGIGARLQQVVRLMPVPEYSTDEGEPSGEILQLIPTEFQVRHRVLPLRRDGNSLSIGFVDGPSPAVLQSIRQFVPGMELRSVHIDSAFFDSVLQAHAASPAPQGVESKQDTSPHQAPTLSLERMLKAMTTEGASDLHLSAGHRPRWRIDGQMQEMKDIPLLGRETAFELLAPVIEERQRAQFKETNDADFSYALPEGLRFRVNLYRDTNGASAVFRYIPSKIPTLEQLGMPEIVTRFCKEPKGMILVTGPTGSGKSTTLAAMVDFINKSRKDHIITLEDPIEFVHPSRLCLVNQREVGSHTQSFSRALRAALREDPDIVLVGEMRDLETVSMALETANTGHLVLGTLHTSTAVLTVDRIVNLFPSDQQNQIRTLLADVLRGVVSQNLLRKIGGGRVASLEIMAVNPAISNLIREGKTVQIPNIMQTGKAQGNQLLNDALAALVHAGKVDAEEAMSKAVDKTDLAKQIKRNAE